MPESSIPIDMQYSRYLHPHDYLQAICYQCSLMQQSPSPTMLVQLLLQWAQFEAYLCVWHHRWTCEYNEPNHADRSTSFVSPPHILSFQHVIPIFEPSCASSTCLISHSQLAATTVIGGSDSVESSGSMILETNKFSPGRCQWRHSLYFAYTRPQHLQCQERFLGWHCYILLCNQVPDTELK